MSQDFDLAVIGAGPGGHAAAEEAARLGARVAIIERDKWGGTCTHLGCIPTKALLACSRRYAEIAKLKRLGISVSGAAYDFPAMKRHQAQMVRISALGTQKSLEEVGAVRFEGEGGILSPGEVEVLPKKGTKERLKAKNIVIAWGSEPFLIPGITMSNRVMNSNGFLALPELPKSFIIVGGGAIGLEFANFLAELGTRVVVVELLEQVLPYEDRESADFIARELNKQGIEIHTSTRINSLEEKEGGVLLKGQKGEQTIDIQGESAVVCAGRSPFLNREELDRLGIHYSSRGISVDSFQRTSVKNIFAVGDVTGGILLAHRASAQGRALANFLFGDGTFFFDENSVPSVVYTHPGIARIGMTEKQALEKGMDFEARRAEYGANIIARAELKGSGFVKTLFSKGRIVGVTIAGDDAGELIASMALAVGRGMGREDLRSWTLPHPSLSEMLKP
jgi:dihydrolipoamide dehydrogenase